MEKLKFHVRRAFTLVELVFIIVVIGIIAAAAIPRYERDLLLECVQQVAAHVRYTQHLAMLDNKIDPSTNNWWRNRWTIGFSNLSYSVTGRESGTGTLVTAEDPRNPGKILDGSDTATGNTDLNIGRKYGVTNVAFSGGCNNVSAVSFDEKGRPYTNISNANNPGAGLITAQCVITLTGDDDTAQICINQETGYVTYGLTSSGGCTQFQ